MQKIGQKATAQLPKYKRRVMKDHQLAAADPQALCPLAGVYCHPFLVFFSTMFPAYQCHNQNLTVLNTPPNFYRD